MGLILNLLILAVLVTASTQQCADNLNEKLLGMMINQEKLTCYRKAFDPGDPGGCPNVATMKGFNITGILGEWYMVAHFSAERFTRSKCSRRVFSKAEDGGSSIRVTRSVIDAITGEHQVDPLPSWLLMPYEKNKEYFVFAMPDGAPHVWYPIATDYTTFLAVLACEQYPPDCPVFHQHHDSIFTRDPDISEEDLTNIFKNFAELHGIHITKFESVDHTDCDYV